MQSLAVAPQAGSLPRLPLSLTGDGRMLRQCVYNGSLKKSDLNFSTLKRGDAPKRVSTIPRAAANKSLIPSHGYDYYELLGIDPSASHEEVKKAYRRLQKRCHPDVAGREDMAVLLNEAYSALSDPISRYTYDQLRVTWLRDGTFSGKPVYSTWHGSEEEETAVFVDEIDCIGCLKCAVLAPKTFAIETKYGRARAVRQWADTESNISDAISACPVNCIKWVERSKLAALEHIMTTLPRPQLHSLRNGSDCAKVPDVFSEAEKFLQKRKKLDKQTEDNDEKRERARGAFEAIRGWWGVGSGRSRSTSAGGGADVALVLAPKSLEEQWKEAQRARESLDGDFIPDDLRALHNAATVNREATDGGFFNLRVGEDEEEYWDPTKPLFANKTKKPAQHKTEAATATATATASAGVEGSMKPKFTPQFIKLEEWPEFRSEMEKHRRSQVDYTLSLFPIFLSLAAGTYAWLAPEANDPANQAAAIAALQAGARSALVPAEVAASAGMRMALSMAVWYAMGSAVAQGLRVGIDFAESWRKK